MKRLLGDCIRIALFLLILIFWAGLIRLPFSAVRDLSIIAGGILMIIPVVWLGRKHLDRRPIPESAVRTTMVVHYALVFLFGAAIFRAVATCAEWRIWTLPVPEEFGLVLVVVSGAALAATVVNLALKGLGAPFAVALSRKLAADWLYAWTRNPMVLATLVFFLSLGIRFQSAMFVCWVLLLLAPAWLGFVKGYEERELEIRFGAPYLEYKSRTPMLFPRRPST
jgi:protein-S-isoprenylcysteine O-methyltransferase Ste14